MLFPALFLWLNWASRLASLIPRSWPRRKPRALRWPFQPHLEALEDRTVPSFVVPAGYPRRDLGLVPRVSAVADFNNDHIPDLVTENYYNLSMSVSLGNGDGTFQAPKPLSRLEEPTSVAVSDFNADGKLDLVLSDGGIYLGNGNGTFQLANKPFTLPKVKDPNGKWEAQSP